jgi:hypothetical protein
MEMNVEKPKVIGISEQPSIVQIMIDEKERENMDDCNCLDFVIINYARFIHSVVCFTTDLWPLSK